MNVAVNAVESFKRARLIDSVTSDDEKVAAIYKLDEVSELLRSSPADVVREVVEYLVKNRLEHRSPFVKQKALRLIKYLAPRAGKETKREIQRHASAIRNLYQFRGQPDPLRGDAPNKAVRDTAHETLEVLFNQEDIKPTNEDYVSTGRKKMEGFGNSAFEPSSNSRPPVPTTTFDNVVYYGTESIKAGFDILKGAADQVSKGALGKQSLRRSLKSNGDSSDGNYQAPKDVEMRGGFGFEQSSEPYTSRNTSGSHYSLEPAENDSQSPWAAQPTGSSSYEGQGAEGPSGNEEKLVDSVTQSLGVRVQPSREALATFVKALHGLDGRRVGKALETKLKSPVWQVRLKALCALEALLRNEGDPTCDFVYNFFVEDTSALNLCQESPQASVREKAKRVFHLLGFTESSHTSQKAPQDPEPTSNSQAPPHAQPQQEPQTLLPDLLDSSFSSGATEPLTMVTEKSSVSVAPPFPDLLGPESSYESHSGPRNTPEQPEIDPFVGLSVHGPEPLENEFSSLTLDPTPQPQPSPQAESSLFDGLTVGDSEQNQKQTPAVNTSSILAAYATPAPNLQVPTVPVLPAVIPPYHNFQALPLLQQQQLFQQQLMMMNSLGAQGLQGGFAHLQPQGLSGSPSLQYGTQAFLEGRSTPLPDFGLNDPKPVSSPTGKASDKLGVFDFVQEHMKAVKNNRTNR